MTMQELLHELPLAQVATRPFSTALVDGDHQISYQALAEEIQRFSSGLIHLGLQKGARVGIYLEKRREMVVASFGTAAAGCAFVPINPLLKPAQIAYILENCGAKILVTSPTRFETLQETLEISAPFCHVLLTNKLHTNLSNKRCPITIWEDLLCTSTRPGYRVIDNDMVAIFYTSGSTGRPKGVVLSHRNMVTGARSVASYLENHSGDTLLAALPLSFDAGFSQLTTAFYAGARVVLLNYLLPLDVIKAIEQEGVTGLTAVPPLYIQLAQQIWPASVAEHLRYVASTGGRMPRDTLENLRTRLPKTKVFLMYGLTEAFRSTFLPPEEVERRPDSIGMAIPNAEILVLRKDGSSCTPNEPGELVHRGPLVSMGYWNDADMTAERFRPLPPLALGRDPGLMLPEIAVFSGDTVRRDEEGYFYFIGRRDEMIKTSGYRVSPTEIEEMLYATGLVGECIAFGVPDEKLGQVIQAIATPLSGDSLDLEAVIAQCRARAPSYMLPRSIEVRSGPLPRNPNGKIDRKWLLATWPQKNGT
jgi:acyl-CoA ligase (AMP-forming) (exosortase A-associated)